MGPRFLVSPGLMILGVKLGEIPIKGGTESDEMDGISGRGFCIRSGFMKKDWF